MPKADQAARFESVITCAVAARAGATTRRIGFRAVSTSRAAARASPGRGSSSELLRFARTRSTRGSSWPSGSGLRAAFALCAVAAAVYAATALRFGAEVNVSRTATPTEKAKVVRLAYLHGSVFRKVWLFTYADGPADQQNVYARHSFDEGVDVVRPDPAVTRCRERADRRPDDHGQGIAQLRGRQREADDLRSADHLRADGRDHLEQRVLPAGPGCDDQCRRLRQPGSGRRRLRRRRDARPALPLRLGGDDDRPGRWRPGTSSNSPTASATPSAK